MKSKRVELYARFTLHYANGFTDLVNEKNTGEKDEIFLLYFDFGVDSVGGL